MAEIWAAAIENLRAPMVLFFALGVVAALVRSDLAIPEPVGKIMALYLMMAIGYKGGAAIAGQGLDWSATATLVAGGLLSFALPFVAYGLLRGVWRTERLDAAAVAAHYGSVSVVTFIAATEFLRLRGVAYDGHMVAVVAVMETPAILTGLWLARRGAAAGRAVPGKPPRRGVERQLLREIAFNGSVVLLVGALLIGVAAGPKGAAGVAPFFDAPFKGVLCLFLLDMGLLAGKRIREIRSAVGSLVGFGIVMPLLGGAAGIGAAALLGIAPGNAALLAVLGASASYIAVPAALRLALPEANPALYLTLSLGITFPFNVAIGIPLYAAAARLAVGG